MVNEKRLYIYNKDVKDAEDILFLKIGFEVNAFLIR